MEAIQEPGEWPDAIRSCRGAPNKAKSKSVTVTVDIVDAAMSTCIVQAIEGAAYVTDPLDYLIETLSRDRARLRADPPRRAHRRLLCVDAAARGPLCKRAASRSRGSGGGLPPGGRLRATRGRRRMHGLVPAVLCV